MEDPRIEKARRVVFEFSPVLTPVSPDDDDPPDGVREPRRPSPTDNADAIAIEVEQ